MYTLRNVRAAIVGSLLLAFSCAAAADDNPLIDAVKRRDSTAINALLRKKADPNSRQADGTTALHWAAYRSDAATVSMLLAAGAKVDAVTDLGVTPLLLACESGSADIASLLLAKGANPNATTTAGESPLMAAARSGAASAVAQLLRRGADANAAEHERQQTALMWAVAAQQPEVVRLLLEAGATVDARTASSRRLVYNGFRYITSPPAESSGTVVEVDLGGFTPLLFAAQQGNVDVTRLLLDAGADKNDQSFLGQTALIIAAHSDHAGVTRLLLERGANPNSGEAGFSALHAAVLRGNLEMVRLLAAAKADLNARVIHGEPVKKYGSEYAITASWKGATPLWLAARFSEHAIVQALLEAGADITIAADEGTVPMFATIPAQGGSNADRRERYRTDVEAATQQPGEEERLTLETVKVLAERHVSLADTDKEGNTLLHLAAPRGYNSVIEYLVAHGADVNAKNKRGMTPLDIINARRRAALAAAGVAPGTEGVTAVPENPTAALLRKLGAR